MDLDDIFPPQPNSGLTVGEDLSQQSVADLEERVAMLRAEIERTEREIGTRQSVRSAAEQAFKL